MTKLKKTGVSAAISSEKKVISKLAVNDHVSEKILRCESTIGPTSLFDACFNVLSEEKRSAFRSSDPTKPPQSDLEELRLASGHKLEDGFTHTDIKKYLCKLLADGRIKSYTWKTCGPCDRLSRLLFSSDWKAGDNVIVLGWAPEQKDVPYLKKALEESLIKSTVGSSKDSATSSSNVEEGEEVEVVQWMVVVPENSQHGMHRQLAAYRTETGKISVGPRHAVGVRFREGGVEIGSELQTGLVASIYDPALEGSRPLTLSNWVESLVRADFMYQFDIELPDERA